MIHLIENYYAIPNNMGFTLVLDKNKTDKNGNKIRETVGYCGNIEEVIFLLNRSLSEDRINAHEYIEISDAMDIIKDTTKEIKEAIEAKIKED